MQSVAIIQRLVANYRVEFLNRLTDRLAESNIKLTVFAGMGTAKEGFYEGLGSVPSAVRVKNYYLWKKIYWQPIFRQLRDFDLVIVEQANSALLNYPLFASRWLLRRPRKIAFWGHGITMQPSDTNFIKAWLKKRISRHVDHWFAYTELSQSYVMATGMDPYHITVVNNSINVNEIMAAAVYGNRQRKQALRARLGFGMGPVAVFCSRLYAQKQLGFLIDACDRVRAILPTFELVVIGDGPERGTIVNASSNRAWLHYEGACYGQKKAEILAAGDVFALPAHVGLSLLDGFAAGLPCISGSFGNHSPEIVYLKHGVNGLMVQADPAVYAEAIVKILSDSVLLAHMSEAAQATARHYSLEAMVNNFAAGVIAALDNPSIECS